jgi:hypothetical protein
MKRMIGHAPPDPEPAHVAPESRPATDEAVASEAPREIGGRAGPDPTRYGDWEKNGRCIDF